MTPGFKPCKADWTIDTATGEERLHLTLAREVPNDGPQIDLHHLPELICMVVNKMMTTTEVLTAVEDCLNHHLAQRDWQTAVAALQVVRSARGTSKLPLDIAVSKMAVALNGPDFMAPTEEDDEGEL